jgi:Protein of unknown function (DUF3551)
MNRLRFLSGAFSVITLGVVALLFSLDGSVISMARAEIAMPYCLSGAGGYWNDRCNYATLAQCQATSAGYGICSQNPRYLATQPKMQMSPKH